MLVLALKLDEFVNIDDKIDVYIKDISSWLSYEGRHADLRIMDRLTGREIPIDQLQVRLGFEAPREIKIIRGELLEKDRRSGLL